MKANIGFILIGLGLLGVYIALGGKFTGASNAATPKTADQVGIANMGTIQPGGAHQPANVPYIPEPGSLSPGETPKDPTTGQPVGSGGISPRTRFTQFGHSVALQPLDRGASHGGF